MGIACCFIYGSSKLLIANVRVEDRFGFYNATSKRSASFPSVLHDMSIPCTFGVIEKAIFLSGDGNCCLIVP